MPTLAQQIGSLLIAGFDGTTLPEEFHIQLERQALGGVILFARNYRGRPALKSLTREIASAAALPGWVAVDQEGGRVVRFAEDFPTFPSSSYFGEHNDLAGLRQATAVTSRCLAEDGISLNLIPVCDLAPDDRSHVLHSRAYHRDPQRVAEAVTMQVRTCRDSGVEVCAKHFPGLVSATGDPHHVVARTRQRREDFLARDYLPFRAAIAAGAQLLMVTHVIADALDPEQIVTFSRPVIDREVRGELAFDGLIVTDDLQMLGALAGVDEVEACVRSMRAGCNLLILANLENRLRTLIAQIELRCDHDRTLRDNVESSHARVMRYRNAQRAGARA